MTVPGIGPIISTATIAAIGSGDAFSKGRDFGAWLGLVPRQMSTGGHTVLGPISKRGNRYLRATWLQICQHRPDYLGLGRDEFDRHQRGGRRRLSARKDVWRVVAGCRTFGRPNSAPLQHTEETPHQKLPIFPAQPARSPRAAETVRSQWHGAIRS
jgi:transposase